MSPQGAEQPLRGWRPVLSSIPTVCWADEKFEAAWMDSDDEREASKLNEKPSGPAFRAIWIHELSISSRFGVGHLRCETQEATSSWTSSEPQRAGSKGFGRLLEDLFLAAAGAL